MKKILVVDDSEDVREFFSFALGEAGYAVETASNGEEGFEKARKARPDLVLLDVIMPGMDGFALLLKLRSDLAPPIPPVILCSGFDVTEEEARRRGATRFVRKPVDARDLVALVGDVLAGRPTAAEAIAREDANVRAARQAALEKARQLLQQIAAHEPGGSASFESVGSEHVSALARYLAVEGVALALLRDDRLVVTIASDGSPLGPGTDLGDLLPPVLAVIETSSSLVLPDPQMHPSFGPIARGLDGIHAFVGVPLVVERITIGVFCVFDSARVDLEPEDLAIIRMFAGESASALSAGARGEPEAQPLIRYGPGIGSRSVFERMLDAELRLLD